MGLVWLVAVAALWLGYGKIMARHPLNPLLDRVAAAAEARDWPGALAAMDDLYRAWRRARPYVEANHGVGTAFLVESLMARLHGALLAHDREHVQAEVEDIRYRLHVVKSPYRDLLR